MEDSGGGMGVVAVDDLLKGETLTHGRMWVVRLNRIFWGCVVRNLYPQIAIGVKQRRIATGLTMPISV